MNIKIRNLKKGEWFIKKINGKVIAFIKNLKINEITTTIKEKNTSIGYDQTGNVVFFSVVK